MRSNTKPKCNRVDRGGWVCPVPGHDPDPLEGPARRRQVSLSESKLSTAVAGHLVPGLVPGFLYAGHRFPLSPRLVTRDPCDKLGAFQKLGQFRLESPP
jgi:hypothetical protein